MSSKKKLITAITSLAVVAVIAVVAVTVTLAALNATVTSGFNISYTATNVQATVSGWYYGGTHSEDLVAMQESAGGANITFTNADENASETKSFKTLEDLEFTSTATKIYLIYKIQNDDTTHALKVGLTVTATGENFSLSYATSTSEVTKENVETQGYTSHTLTSGNKVADVATIQAKAEEDAKSTYVVVKIEMSNVTKNVNLTDGSVAFTLDPGEAA